MKKKLQKNFPHFTGRKIIFFLLSISTISAIIFLIVLSTIFTCKKDSIINRQYFIGKWELEKLTIDGHDTTAFIKGDTNCYGYTNFLENYFLGQIPVYKSGANFYCAQKGRWDYIYKRLIIDYNVSFVNVGPYLAGERLEWQVLEKSDNHMRLYIIYQNMPCFLEYKKK